MRRHFIIPDRQAKPGVPLDHNYWIGRAIADYSPDVVIDLGDAADFPSISRHSAQGTLEREGARLSIDIDAANEAEQILRDGMGRLSISRRPRFVRLHGNHEDRLSRYVNENPTLDGLVGLHLLDNKGWEVVPYDNGAPGIVMIDGVAYAHYFANPNTGKPIAGSIQNRLAKIGCSFVQGHQQGLFQGNLQHATGRTTYGVCAGSAYLHDEGYKGAANAHWRGVVILNEVRNGQFCEMPLSLDYLCRKYEGMSVKRYLQRNYRRAKERFSLARAA